MWIVKGILWIIKLVCRILLVPVWIVTSMVMLMANLMLHLSSVAVGIVALILCLGIISKLVDHDWAQAALGFGITAAGYGVFLFAGIIIILLEEANAHLGAFILHG